MKLKKGDTVVVIAGSNKGKQGEILQMFPEKNKAIVADVNIVRKHVKPTPEDEGGIRDVEAPIHLSNLMLVDPKSGEPTRVGRKEVDGKLVRYSKKSGEIIN
ncbi:MAG: 50S ribosomal protein L24 [Bacteroidota bacterium]